MFKKIISLKIIFSKSEKNKLRLLFFGLIIGSFFEFIGIGMIPIFIMTLVDSRKLFEIKYINTILQGLNLTNQGDVILLGSVILILIFLIKNIYLVFLNKFKFDFIFKKQFDLESLLFAKYIKAPFLFHLNRSPANLHRNLIIECSQIIQLVLLSSFTLVIEGVMIFAIFIAVILADPLTALISISFMMISSYSMLVISQKKISLYGELEVALREEKIKSVLQSLSSIKEIIILRKDSFFINKFNYLSSKSSHYLKFKGFITSLSRPFIESLSIISIFIVIIVMTSMGKDIESLIAVLALYGAAAVRLMPTFNSLVVNYNNLKFGVHSITPVIEDLIYFSNESENKKVCIKKIDFSHELSFEKIYFKYPNINKFSLIDINLKIKKGENIGITGVSGSGKTTLINILLGLIEPTKGKVLVDNEDIKDNLISWRKNLGYVPQDIILLDDSIANNIAFGVENEEIDMERVREVAKLAELDSFINGLEFQYNTIVGDKGVRISGGERQRIGIARSLYFKPRLLILDEATSALDNYNEKLIIETLNSLKSELTIITIAHRLSTIRNCDIIYFLEDGKVRSKGKYDYLEKYDSTFKTLSDLNRN